VVKEKDKSPIEEEVDLVPEDKEQGKHEEVTKHRMVESYQSLIPFLQRFANAKLETKFGKFLEVLKKL